MIQKAGIWFASTLTIIIILSGVTVYLFIQKQNQAEKIKFLLEERNYFLLENASTTNKLESANLTIITLTEQINYLNEETSRLNNKIADNDLELNREKNKNEEFAGKIKKISGTIEVLDKLSKTDEELLAKYSKTYFLNENFIPMKVSKIDEKYILAGKKDQYFHGDAIKFLIDMIEEASKDGIDLKIISAYRSFEEQADLKGQFSQIYGTGANTFSADQGYSEHQLGTTVDITDKATAGTYTSFENTEAFVWLQDNAHRFGFILSYPKNNNFYIYEPWHWRFIGRDLAKDLNRNKVSFQDWDQRKIDEYLVKIFD